MSSLSDLVPIPPGINTGLSACRETTMLAKFGFPGPLSSDCKSATGDVRSLMKFRVSVGPFKVNGMGYAVESLGQILSELKSVDLDAYSQLKTAGMLCVRAIRHNPAHYSNHSWGTAIDLYFSSDVVRQGRHMTQRGFTILYPIFNRHGWFWGAGFSGGAVDSMHFELANETIQNVSERPEESLVAADDYITQLGYNNVSETDA